MLPPDKPKAEVSQGALKMRAWRERKKAGLQTREFICEVCKQVRQTTHPQTRACQDCRTQARTAYQRRRNGHVAIGTEFDCKHCGSKFAKQHKRQFYCPPCLELSANDQLPASKEWNRNYQREYQKRRRQESAHAAINARMAAGIRNSLANGKEGRSWESLVGYTIADLMPHLEAQFLPGMNWANRADWHIDHRRPLVSFDFQTPDCPQFREAWALTNLQPLWAVDNLKKGGRWAA